MHVMKWGFFISFLAICFCCCFYLSFFFFFLHFLILTFEFVTLVVAKKLDSPLDDTLLTLLFSDEINFMPFFIGYLVFVSILLTSLTVTQSHHFFLVLLVIYQFKVSVFLFL